MKSRDTGVKQFYDRVGDYFSHTRKWLWPEMLPYLTRLTANDTVLDIGCGNGRLIQGIPVPVKYVGVDFSQMLLANAANLHPERRFVYGDILEQETWKHLPKANALFSVAVLHHMQQPQLEHVIKQMAAKLKKDGFVYVSVWNLWQKKYLRDHVSKKSLLAKMGMIDVSAVWVPFQNNNDRFCVAHSPISFTKAAKKANLEIETMFYSGSNSWLHGKNLVAILKQHSSV